MSSKRILFVDDEAQLLDGLRNVLRKQRHEWDMVFAVGGQAALDELAKAPFDVIVTDMRMPGMDGAALLHKVKDRHPRTTRIVLSGHAEREAVMRVLPVAHQFLSKPCDVEQLRAVVQRSCNLQAMLHDDTIRGIVSGLNKLPSVPGVYWDITRAVAQPNISLNQIAAIVERDPSLVIKILQIVNSAFFGLRNRITSIPQAIQYLGLDLVKELTLVGVFSASHIAPIEGWSVEDLQHHSVMTAALAKRLIANPERANDVFVAAMVHDVGQLIVADRFRDQFGEARKVAASSGRPFHEVELEMFGVTHAEIGAYLVGMWGLPLSIVEAVAYHHRPRIVEEGERSVLATVHVADVLIDAASGGWTDEMTNQSLDTAFLEACGIVTELDRWSALAKDECQAAAAQ